MSVQIKKQRIYEGLVEDIRLQIHNGTLRADNYLLPEYELARKYQMSSHAVRQGLARLEAEGLIRRYQGRGTVVLPRQDEQEPAPRNKNVAVIFQGRVRDSSTAEDFDGLQQAFQQEGYGTTLYVADGEPEKEAQIVRQLAAEGVPGLVLYSAHSCRSDKHLREALAAGMKVVVFDHDFPELDCNFVGIDDHLAAFEAAEHLIRLGCRELLFINSERDWTTHELRQRGFERAAEERGIPFQILKIPNRGLGHFDQYIQSGIASLCGPMRRPVGIVAWWDEVALRAIRCLREMGWSVPEEGRVIGFANDRSGEVAEIPLTTMEIPRDQIAHLAAAALVNQMRDPARPPQRIRLKTRMIIRESCGTYRPDRSAADFRPQSSLSPVSA